MVSAADDDPDQSERHFQRGAADGGGRALAGLSAAGVLQPGTRLESFETRTRFSKKLHKMVSQFSFQSSVFVPE